MLFSFICQILVTRLPAAKSALDWNLDSTSLQHNIVYLNSCTPLILVRNEMKLCAAFCVVLVTLGAADDCHVGDTDVWFGDIRSWWSHDFQLCKDSCRTESRLFFRLYLINFQNLDIMTRISRSFYWDIVLYIYQRIQFSMDRLSAFGRSKLHCPSCLINIYRRNI